jgi:hypothetical protein
VTEKCGLETECGVVYSLWKDFKKSLDSQYISSDDNTACCAMDGVECSGDKVIGM